MIKVIVEPILSERTKTVMTKKTIYVLGVKVYSKTIVHPPTVYESEILFYPNC